MMKEYISDILAYIKDAGMRGVLCEIFNVDSKHHNCYKWGLATGMAPHNSIDSTKAIILSLARSLPKIEPVKTRTICTIRGMSDAVSMRENVGVVQ